MSLVITRAMLRATNNTTDKMQRASDRTVIPWRRPSVKPSEAVSVTTNLKDINGTLKNSLAKLIAKYMDLYIPTLFPHWEIQMEAN